MNAKITFVELVDLIAESTSTTKRVCEVVHLHHLDLILGIVGDNNFDRIQNGTHAVGVMVQFFADVVLKQADVVQRLILGVADVLDEIFDGLGRIAAASQATK